MNRVNNGGIQTIAVAPSTVPTSQVTPTSPVKKVWESNGILCAALDLGTNPRGINESLIYLITKTFTGQDGIIKSLVIAKYSK